MARRSRSLHGVGPASVANVTDESPLPQIAVNLPPEQEIGVFADFAAVWHNPTSFVIDFLSLVAPPQQQVGPDGETVPVVSARVATRVRLPAEQIFRVIGALQEQADQWLAQSGKEEPPEGWFPTA